MFYNGALYACMMFAVFTWCCAALQPAVVTHHIVIHGLQLVDNTQGIQDPCGILMACYAPAIHNPSNAICASLTGVHLLWCAKL